MPSTSETPKRQSGESIHWRKRTSFRPKAFHAWSSSSPMSRVPSPPTTPEQSSSEMPAQTSASSGLLSSMEEIALSQYTGYKTSGWRVDHRSAISGLSAALYTHFSSDDNQAPSRLTTPPWTRCGGYDVGAFAACLPFLDFLGKGTFQMAMDHPSVAKKLSRYCEQTGFEENMTFLTKVSLNPWCPPRARVYWTVMWPGHSL